MKRITAMLAATLFAAVSASAQVVFGEDEKSYMASDRRPSASAQPAQLPATKASLKSGYKLSGIGDNWFASANFGMSSFLGHPKGCTDFFGRNQFTTVVGIGKWHSPYFGTRIAYQGFKFTSASLLKQDYQNYHADFLLNVSSFYHADHSVLSRWNVSPYIGGGIIHNATMEKTLFGLSYGILGSYRICERLHLNMDLGGTTTFQDFDGIGKKNHIGDNLLQGSIGITVSMGRLGWKKKPKGAASLLSYSSSTNAELSFPRNDYSGLNSLRKRMADGVGDDKNAAQTPDGSIKLDAPILFFFKINSTTLIDSQQKVNIKEIAGAVKEYDLKVKIIGAADSKTGTPKTNRELSIKRARYIAKLLNKAGVPKEKMTGASRGGIDLYKPYTANRHTCVILYKE